MPLTRPLKTQHSYYYYDYYYFTTTGKTNAQLLPSAAAMDAPSSSQPPLLSSGAAQPAAPPRFSRWARRCSGTAAAMEVHSSPQPPLRPSGAAQPAVPPALTPVLTVAGLLDVDPQSGIGGKAACQWQRSLRQQCINADIDEVDITCDSAAQPVYLWQQLLRASAPDFARTVIGPGVHKFVFRLLNQLDNNYTNIDNKGRRVFEVQRIDGSAVRLHYHKSGTCDAPEFIGRMAPTLPGERSQASSSGAPQPAAGPAGAAPQLAAQPALVTMDDVGRVARVRQPLGRKQATIALQILLHAHHGEGSAGAVELTDGTGFNWLTWVASIADARELVRGGVRRVFAVRCYDRGDVFVAFCRDDGTFSMLCPQTQSYDARGPTLVHNHSPLTGWQNEPLFRDAPTATQSWQDLRTAVYTDLPAATHEEQ